MKIAWTHFGPPRAQSIPVPPTPSLIDWYALDYDGDREQIVYVCRPDDRVIEDDRGCQLQAFDGSAWHEHKKGRFKLKEMPQEGNIEGGSWDSSRHGFVAWVFPTDYVAKRRRACGLLLTDAGMKELATHGDDPVAEPENEDDEAGTFDKQGMFAFDRERRVWVCVTRAGVWELDASGAWSRKLDGKTIPKKWESSSGEGTYDTVGKRTVFFLQGEDGDADDAHVALAWDGSKLVKLPMSGLPELTVGFNDSMARITGHPKLGIVLHTGAGLFHLSGSAWKALPEASSPPPKMEKALLAYDPKRDLFVLGPGKHEGAGGSDRNDVFFVLRNGAWQQQGVAIVHSPLDKASYSQCRLAHVKGVWYALGSHSLRTWRWTGDAWKEITDDSVGNGKFGGWELLELVVSRDQLHAVMQGGGVYALEGDKWKIVLKQDPSFKKRQDYALATDVEGRLVVWGGTANGRKLNDTLYFEKKKWRATKKTSPQPPDFKHGNKDGVYAETVAIYDSALGAIVRFGFEDIAVLGADETWTAYKPKGYKANITERKWGHVPVHDPQTGETLIVDFSEEPSAPPRPARVSRFDLAACTPLATIEYPPETAMKKATDTAAYFALAETFSYDATTRSLYAQVLHDAAGTYRLDLGPLFDAAKNMGARTLPKASASAKAAPPKVYRVQKGELESSAKPKAGFVPATELSRDALAELVGVESRELTIGKAPKGAAPKSRLGGEPSGVTAATWPRARKKPMGFLFQVETGSLLRKHAGVAVFCALDGEATSEPDENAVVLLRELREFEKTCPAPEGLPVLPVRALAIDDPKIEIDEDRALRIAGKDADLGAAFERLQTMKGVQEHGLANKVGGLPEFLQGEAGIKGHKFVAQLDFDSISTSKAWPDAGLMGCVYVFVSDDEKKAMAFWQYT
jgi:hypothetical protein